MSTTADPRRAPSRACGGKRRCRLEQSLEDVLQKTADVAARLVDARYAALGVLDRTGAHLERLITTGMDETTRARIGDLPSDHGVLRVLLREARPVRVADVTKEQQFFGFPPAHPRMRSFLGVPIFVRGVVYGDLYLAEKEGRRVHGRRRGDRDASRRPDRPHDRKGADPRGGNPLDSAARGARRAHTQRARGARSRPPARTRCPSPARAGRRPRSADLPSRIRREVFASSSPTARVSPIWSATTCLPNRGTRGHSRAARASASTRFSRIPRSIRSLPAESAPLRRYLSRSSFRAERSGSCTPSTRTGPTPASPTTTFASPKRWVRAPPLPFISQNAWRAKRSTRSSKPRRPSGAGSHESCTTRRAPR